MDKTNDKLPEEIQEQIKTEAEAHKKKPHYRGGAPLSVSPQLYLKLGYEAGATAWAPWKVKHDEERKQRVHLDKENDLLKANYQELQAQSQRMASLLMELLEAYGDHLTDHYIIRIGQALQQFKDGKGKDAELIKEIEYMPIHPEDARKFDCPTQFPMHLLSEAQAKSNHGQTLKRLKERGGLSVREILAIVGKKNWSYYGNLKWEEAIKMLNNIIITNPTK